MQTTPTTAAERLTAGFVFQRMKISVAPMQRKHNAESRNVEARNNAEKGRAKVVVNLCEGIRSYEAAKAAAAALREVHVKFSAPTTIEGMRVVSVARLPDYTAAVNSGKSAYSAAVSRFLAEYPNIRANAAVALGGLFDPAAWPHDIAPKFSVEHKLLPPPKEWTEELEAIGEIIAQDSRDKLREAVQNAARACTGQRLHAATLVNNILDAAGLCADYNVIADLELADAAREARALATSAQLSALKDSQQAREDYQRKLEDLARRMDSGAPEPAPVPQPVDLEFPGILPLDLPEILPPPPAEITIQEEDEYSRMELELINENTRARALKLL